MTKLKINEIKKEIETCSNFIELYTYKDKNKKLENEFRRRIAELRAELKGYQIAKQEFIEMIDKKIILIKKWTQKYETDDFGNIQRFKSRMKYYEKKKQIEILEELKKSLNSQETKSSNVLAECSSDSSPDKSLGGKNEI